MVVVVVCGIVIVIDHQRVNLSDVKIKILKYINY